MEDTARMGEDWSQRSRARLVGVMLSNDGGYGSDGGRLVAEEQG